MISGAATVRVRVTGMLEELWIETFVLFSVRVLVARRDVEAEPEEIVEEVVSMLELFTHVVGLFSVRAEFWAAA